MTTDLDTTIQLEPTPDLPGLHARRPRLDDAEYEAIAQLAHAVAAADDVPWRPTPAHIRDDFERRPGIDPTQDIVIVEDDGRIVAHAAGPARGPRRRGRLPPVRLRPSRRPPPRPGSGAPAREHPARHGARRRPRPATGRWSSGRSPSCRRPATAPFWSSEGFGIIRWFFLMRRDLSGADPRRPAARWPGAATAAAGPAPGGLGGRGGGVPRPLRRA